ncbi:hypothetical protein BC936DRAFT_149755 [Jimgerdemannia flammicorona]|uniref:Uncharacterized protein n=1 Tax=Jimgerdemannia flammicorona TaxID=994334 RepID=A0A433D061_9FUNG|nr:hypothetical protein BC936DRAFT_149755 [Jimgerdemannia flammicorona]
MAKAEGPVEYTRTLDEARAFVCTLQLKPNTFKRGSFLAELELELRSGDQNGGNLTLPYPAVAPDPARLVDLAVAYFDRFGSKAACFEDLQPYVKKLAGDKEAARAFVARLAFVAKLAPETTENSGGIRNLHKQINIRKFERFLGLHDDLNAAEAIKLVDVLWAEYIKALPYGTCNLDKPTSTPPQLYLTSPLNSTTRLGSRGDGASIRRRLRDPGGAPHLGPVSPIRKHRGRPPGAGRDTA